MVPIPTTINNEESAQIIVSQQPSAGVLFKSQNGSTWTANQYEDLKYVIHKAKFTTETGTVRFYSPILSESNSLIRNLRPNPINMSSRQLKIGMAQSAILAATIQHVGCADRAHPPDPRLPGWRSLLPSKPLTSRHDRFHQNITY